MEAASPAGRLLLPHRSGLVRRSALARGGGVLERLLPGDKQARETAAIAETVGYEVVATFQLPGSVWWDNYYMPLRKRLPELKKMAAGNPDAEAQVAFSEWEIEMYREHGSEYGYEFFVLRSR